MGPSFVDFTFAFDTTLIQLEITKIWPKYVAQTFLPPLESSAQNPFGIGLIKPCKSETTMLAIQSEVLNCTISCIFFIIPTISNSQDAGNAKFVQVEKEIKLFTQVEMKI